MPICSVQTLGESDTRSSSSAAYTLRLFVRRAPHSKLHAVCAVTVTNVRVAFVTFGFVHALGFSQAIHPLL